jgi:NAD(P)-dependent dehydrogenase (short-subunit alcohol dehydrogenase family)
MLWFKEFGPCVIFRVTDDGAARDYNKHPSAVCSANGARPSRQSPAAGPFSIERGHIMTTVLITGANRGLGLEFSRQYAQAGWKVIACCRNPQQADELLKLAELHPNLSILPLDLADFAQIDELARTLADESIDVLLCNAGLYGDRSGSGFGELDYRLWTESFLVNAQAPVRLAESLLPQIRRSQRRLIVAMTSLMGSMGDNSSGGSILYRSSKAALNSAMKSLSLDLKAQGIGVLILHPGWVRTDMGGSSAPTSPEDSIRGMRKLIESFTPADSGNFVNFRGQILPW